MSTYVRLCTLRLGCLVLPATSPCMLWASSSQGCLSPSPTLVSPLLQIVLRPYRLDSMDELEKVALVTVLATFYLSMWVVCFRSTLQGDHCMSSGM